MCEQTPSTARCCIHAWIIQAGQFGGDNRAGIDRTLHRISAIRNRDGKVIGLTCRIGRAVLGSAAIAADLAMAGVLRALSACQNGDTATEPSTL